MQRICPSIDISGHGTHVAGIAAGNGNGNEQNTKYRGVAYESTLIIVKLKTSGGASFPTTTQIMLAVDFCIRKSVDMNMPIAINLSFGTSNGSHSGTSLLEAYLDYIAGNYRCAVSVGSGNDGAGFGHANGSSYPADAELAIGYPEPSLSIDLWKNTGMRYSCALVHQIMICLRFPIQLPIRQRALHTDTISMGQTYI